MEEARKAPRTTRPEPPREAKRKRRPLAELTNSVASSQSSCTSAVVKPRKTSSSSTVAPLPRPTRLNTKLAVSAAGCIGTRNTENHSSAPLSPPASGTGRDVNLERSVYSRRSAAARAKRESIGKEIADSFASSVPPLSNPDFGYTENEYRGIQVSKPDSVPHKKAKRRKATSKVDTSKYGMPQDFINKQKKYFAEVDAFPLSEEEVSSDELE